MAREKLRIDALIQTYRAESAIKDLAATLFLLLVAIALFYPLLLAPDSLIYNSDISYFFAHETVIEQSYSQGDFPLWNPYFGAGSPGLSKIQVGLFYPPMVLLRFILNVQTRLNWDAVINVFIAGLGIYWLMRDLVTSRTAAVFSAIAFMLSGSIMPRVYEGHASVLHAVVWTGWLLFAYRRMLRRRSWWYLLLTVLISAFVILGGHPQMSAIVLFVPLSYFLFCYAIKKVKNQRWSELLQGLALSTLVAVLAVGLTAAQWIPFVEWLTFSARGSGTAFDSFEVMIRHSVQLPHLATPLLPLAWALPESHSSIHFGLKTHFWEVSPFVGFLTLWLIGIGLFSVKGKNRLLIAYFIGLGLLGLVMSMGADNPLYPFILERLPYIRAPGRFLLLWTFSLATLAGIFLDGLLKIISGSKDRPEFKRPAYLATAFALAGIAFVLWLTNDEGILQSQLQTLATLTAAHPIVLRELLQRSLLIMAVTLVLIAGLFWAARISAVSATIWGWLAVAVLLVEMVLFARPLVQPYPLTRLVDPRDPLATLNIDPGKVRIDDYRKPPNYLVPTLRHVKNGEEHVALLNLLAAGEKGPQLLAASYVATAEPSADPALALIQQQESAFLYRHEETAPRIYGAPEIALAADDDEALAMVLNDSFDRLEQAVVTLPSNEELATENLWPNQLPFLSSQESSRADFSGEYVDYGNDLITARIVTDRPVMVVFSELYYPGWSATVDGEPAEIWKTNYTLRGVTVPEGEHLVEMRFSPPVFRLSMAISLATVGLILVVSVLLVVRKMNRPSVQD